MIGGNVLEHHLTIFVEVVEQKNFTKAAQKLHISQPAISQSIANLEAKLGARLIERTNKEVRLNKAGLIVYQYAKQILRNYEEMTTLVSDLINEPSGSIKIGASYTIGEYVLPNVLGKLQQTYPLINPHVKIGNTDEIGKDLLDNTIDIGLIEGDFTHHYLNKQNFAHDELYVYSNKKLDLPTDKQELSEFLSNETWVIREEGSGTRIMSENFFKRHNIKPKTILQFGSTQIIKEAVENGIGISLMSKWAIKREISLGTVSQLNIPSTPVTRKFSIITHNHHFSPKAVKVFEETVLNHIYTE